jgi:predicted PurR-regulated permease PerM
MPTLPSRPQDLTRLLFSSLAILALLLGCLWVMRPFLAPLVWAAMICVATWPLLLRLQARLWQRRSLAVAGMVLVLLTLFFVPLGLATLTLADHADEALAWLRSLSPAMLAEPPTWLAQLPQVGPKLAQLWRDTAAKGASALLTQVGPFAGSLARDLFRQAGVLGSLALQALLTVGICGVLYAEGESVLNGITRFVQRLGGARGVHALHLAGMAVRGVALGVVVSALIQALLAGLGLLVTGIPGAGWLTAAMLVLSIAQVGPLPVLLASAAWLGWKDEGQWALALLVWSALVASIDNVLRPWLIRQGADLPLWLIFAGVIGGLLSFGLIGLFIGPVMLAVSYTLLQAWIDNVDSTATADNAGDSR